MLSKDILILLPSFLFLLMVVYWHQELLIILLCFGIWKCLFPSENLVQEADSTGPAVWLFTPNNEFLEDFRLTQSPLWIAKSSIIRSLGKKDNWIAFSLGYGYGAKISINSIERDAILSQMPLSLIYAHSVGKRHTLKLALASGIRFKQGADFDAFAISYQYRWLDKSVIPQK